MVNRSWIARALVLSVILAASPISGRALAADPFTISGLSLRYQESTLTGPLFDPIADGICLAANQSLDRATLAGALTLSAGQTAIPVTAVAGGDCVRPTEDLQFETTYTLTVKGGAQGLLSQTGESLTADQALTFTTSPRLPVVVATLSAPGADAQMNAPSGATVSRRLGSVGLSFSRLLHSANHANLITVTNSKDEVQPWYTYAAGDRFSVMPPMDGLLPKGESYTIRIKGGADGLQFQDGTHLDQDLTYQFTTNTNPERHRISVGPTPFSSFNSIQIDQYAFKAGAGTFSFEPEIAPTMMVVDLSRASTGETIYSQRYAKGAPVKFTAELPDTDTYYLTIGPNTLSSFTIAAVDLEVSPILPVPSLDGRKGLTVEKGRFTVNPTIINPGQTGRLQLLFGGKAVWSQTLTTEPTPAGTTSLTDQRQRFGPVELDTTGLGDGLYTLMLVAGARQNDSSAIATSRVLVDNVSTFPDTATAWSRPWVEALAASKIVGGRADGSFDPGAPVTRAEFAKMLAGTLQLQPAATSALTFADMPTDWGGPYLRALVDAGLLKGELRDGQRYIDADRQITRAEAIVIIGRYLGVDQTNITGQPAPVTDWHLVPTWAQPSVLVLKRAGVVSGRPDGSFAPLANLQRDETAKLIGTFLGL